MLGKGQQNSLKICNLHVCPNYSQIISQIILFYIPRCKFDIYQVSIIDWLNFLLLITQGKNVTPRNVAWYISLEFTFLITFSAAVNNTIFEQKGGRKLVKPDTALTCRLLYNVLVQYITQYQCKYYSIHTLLIL